MRDKLQNNTKGYVTSTSANCRIPCFNWRQINKIDRYLPITCAHHVESGETPASDNINFNALSISNI